MRFRHVLTALAALSASATLLGLTTTAQATAQPYYAQIKKLPISSGVAMRDANDHLFVAAGNSVYVLSETGALQTEITGMSGVSDLTTTADELTLYAALSGSGQVAVIDTTSLAVTATWSAGECARTLALSGSVLFYGYGCTAGQGAIGALSTTDGSALSTGISDMFYAPPRMVVAGSTLIVGTEGISPSPIGRYDISGNTLTLGTDAVSAENLEDLAASPDGTKLATAAGGEYHLLTRDPTNLAQTGIFDTGPYPTAVAFSHDSSLLAGGLNASYSPGLFVFDVTTGSQIVAATVPHVEGASYSYAVLSNTVNFNGDDSRVFALVRDFAATNTYLVTVSTTKPVASSVKLSVTSPKRFGGQATAVAHVGVSKAHVTVSVESNGQTHVHHVIANASGVVRYSWKPTYSGKVTVSFQGDLTHVGSQRSATYRAASTIRVRMTTPFGRTGGVLRYHSATDVASGGVVRPYAYGRTVATWLMAWRGGHWRKVGAVAQAENTHGAVYVHLISARTGTLYKFRYLFKGDSFNRGSTKDSPKFTVG
jgi:YVTN family beta-propeller protein